jgi:hypothetical protein
MAHSPGACTGPAQVYRIESLFFYNLKTNFLIFIYIFFILCRLELEIVILITNDVTHETFSKRALLRN